ncbi:IS21 family transposase [Elizabethkingia ursingii]
MAGKIIDMSKIKQLLRLHLSGYSNRKIALSLGLNKETVNRYVSRVKQDNLPIKALLGLEDPVLEYRLFGGHPAYSDHRFEHFKELLPYLEQEMRRKHVTLKLLWEEYIQDYPKGYSLTQFRFHYNQHTGARKNTTVLRDNYSPGEKLYVDFAGDTMHYVDIVTGELIKAQVFIACLPMSDYGFALAVPSQRSEDFIYALSRCFESLSGVSKILVPDNLKSAVIKSDRYEPSINKTLEDFANHYGCVVIPARPGKPRDKSLVEDQVKLFYNRVSAQLRNRTFYSLDELNAAIAEKMKAHNQKRMQQRPYSREEQYLALEKPALLPLPSKPFEIKSYSELKVGINGCIYLGRDKHYYSVPYQYTGSYVKIIYTRTLVKIFFKGECIATHKRDYKAGSYTLVKEHLASHSKAYRERSPSYYITKGKQALDELGEVIEKMFSTTQVPPETFYKSCEGLLHLHRTTDPILFRTACEIALRYRSYRYAFILNLIKSKCRGVEKQPIIKHPVNDHGNIRGKEHFK